VEGFKGEVAALERTGENEEEREGKRERERDSH
jgi:hypothetical protein